ncbi:MAG: fimbrial biogenesis chaperone [Vulcanimicrobiaceae bacterium]
MPIPWLRPLRSERRAPLALALTLCWSLVWQGAVAASISIAPTQLAIVHDGGSVDLSIADVGDDPASFAVHAYRWTQEPSGKIALEPTDDLIVYPQRLNLAPLERQIVRIGYPGSVGAHEADYRIVVSELPSLAAPASSPSLALRMRYSIPLFIASPAARPQTTVTSANLGPAALAFDLLNAGNGHATATSVHARALAAGGSVVVERALPAWYLLPGQPRQYALALAPGQCARIQELVVDASFADVPPLHATVAPARSC